VVLAELDAWAAGENDLRAYLSTAESTRAARFVTPALQTNFVVAHGLLRLVLGRCLDVSPAALAFGEEARGKPFLVAPRAPLAFNLSHTRRFMAVALAADADGPVGVDIEEVDRAVSAGLIEACTSPQEHAFCQAAPEGEARRALFFRIWTRKEAVLKAAGVGLGVALREIEVHPARDAATLSLVRPEDASLAATSFVVSSLVGLPAGLCGAVAVRGSAPLPVALHWLSPPLDE
jgi:4'-phosphopantetheinyl transferase